MTTPHASAKSGLTTERDRLHLAFLAISDKPLWGGHLQRGEPITDPDMQRWLDSGLIKRIGNEGYVISEIGLREIEAHSEHRGDR